MFSPASSARNLFRLRLLFLVLVTVVPWFLSVGQSVISADSLNATLTQARTYVQQKTYADAITLYRRYLLIKPTDDDVRNELAKTYSWNSQYDSALAQYEIVLRNNRGNFDAHFGTCQVLAWKHDFPDALKELETLFILSPQNIDVLLLAGKIHAWDNEFAQSLEMYQKVLALDGLNEEALLGKSSALEALGQREEAYATITDARTRLPQSAAIEKLYEELSPRPKNQVYVNFQDEHFDIAERSDHRTFTAQYYRTMRTDLTLYAEFDRYRRFDQNDQSFGIGTYWTIADRQSLYAYCLVSPDPKVTSTVDCSVELTQGVTAPLDAFLAYRYLHFTAETAHILSPGVSLGIVPGIVIQPRMYISRTVVARTTSIAYALHVTWEMSGTVSPFFYYAVGNEAYRGVTLDNVESSESWSMTIGTKYVVSNTLTFTVGYQYLNRIGLFRSNALSVGGGYYW
jgi:YaiO family outer membrane protein